MDWVYLLLELVVINAPLQCVTQTRSLSIFGTCATAHCRGGAFDGTVSPDTVTIRRAKECDTVAAAVSSFMAANIFCVSLKLAVAHEGAAFFFGGGFFCRFYNSFLFVGILFCQVCGIFLFCSIAFILRIFLFCMLFIFLVYSRLPFTGAFLCQFCGFITA